MGDIRRALGKVLVGLLVIYSVAMTCAMLGSGPSQEDAFLTNMLEIPIGVRIPLQPTIRLLPYETKRSRLDGWQTPHIEAFQWTEGKLGAPVPRKSDYRIVHTRFGRSHSEFHLAW